MGFDGGPRTDPALYLTGEKRHETCQFSDITQTWIVPADAPDLSPHPHEQRESPGLATLCRWSLPDPHPPAANRAWGGLVEFERDCAVCPAYKPVEAKPLDLGKGDA